MEELSIGEVARRAGIRTSALRNYESIGLLPAPKRVRGRRRYGSDTVRQLTVLRFAQQAGFTIAEMQTLFHGFKPDVPPRARWQKLAQRKMAELDQLVARAQEMRRLLEEGLSCGCVQWDGCVMLAGDDDGRPAKPAAFEN